MLSPNLNYCSNICKGCCCYNGSPLLPYDIKRIRKKFPFKYLKYITFSKVSIFPTSFKIDNSYYVLRLKTKKIVYFLIIRKKYVKFTRLDHCYVRYIQLEKLRLKYHLIRR